MIRSRPHDRVRIRGVVRHIHLWLGLTLGALFVLAGLTGSMLVFYPRIDAALNPEMAVAAPVAPVSWERAYQTVRAAYPDKFGPWRFEATGAPGAIPARYYNPPERAGADFAPMLVWLSPDGDRVLRRDYWGDSAMTWIYNLHYRLLIGPVGGVIMGYAGLALLVLLLSGLWAWWPRGGQWKKALALKRGAPPIRALYDWHKLAGLTSIALSLMLVGTGVMLALPVESNAVLAPVLGPVDKPVWPATAVRGRLVGVDQAVARAQATLPDARLAWIETPPAAGGVYVLRMQQPGDPSHRFPHSYVFVDAADGRVSALVDAQRAGTLTTVNNWLHALHDGSAGGLLLRWLVLVAGLAPLGLFATGVLRWQKRRGARQSGRSV